jgi:ParB-like chromosome segregation protein Spo0J
MFSFPPMKTVQVSEITPYSRNAREHSAAQIAQIVASIREFGFTNPVLIDENNVLIAGHGRLEAARYLSMPQLPAIVLTGLSDAQKAALRIADNKLALNASWDDDLLRTELMDLRGAGFDLALTGFGEDELLSLFADANAGLTDPDDVPEPPVEPVTKLGDVWLLGRHRLVCGDATSEVDVSLCLGGVRPTMVLTDPPYGMALDTDFSGAVGSLKSAGRKSGTRGKRYDPIIGDNEDFSPELIDAVFVAGRDAREVFLFGADYYAELLPDKNNGSWLVWDKRKESQSEAIGSEFELIWSKRRHKRRMLRHDWFGFLSSSNPQEARARVHPAQKPSSLLVDIIEQWGNSAEAVYDPFVGSGTTIIAAEMTGRACHAIEISPAYVDVAVQRWQNFTGQTAMRPDGQAYQAAHREAVPAN